MCTGEVEEFLRPGEERAQERVWSSADRVSRGHPDVKGLQLGRFGLHLEGEETQEGPEDAVVCFRSTAARRLVGETEASSGAGGGVLPPWQCSWDS